VASSVNLTLELRPDDYRVKVLGRAEENYRINPELTVAKIIDQLMDEKGAWRCYDLAPLKAAPLSPSASLYDQRVLPYHSRYMQSEHILEIRRKPLTLVWSIGILVISIVLGLLVGLLIAQLLPNR
jgi:hypothetical protein